MTNEPPPPRPRVGISTCLLGERVRHDGGHKLDADLVAALAPHVEWVPVCPEVELGMGVPREPVDLAGDPAAPRMIAKTSRRDWTDAMRAWSADRIVRLRRERLDGFVLMQRSPSCGLGSVPVHRQDGTRAEGRSGLWAAALASALPDLPIAEAAALADPARRDDFLRRVREHARRR